MKKVWNFDFQWYLAFDLAFMTFTGLFQFFWDPWCLRSPVICSSHISEHYFIKNSFCLRFPISDHCASPSPPSPLKEVQTSFLNFLWNFTPPLEEQKEGWEGWGRAGRKASRPQPDFRFLGPLGVIFFTLYSEINPKISDFLGEGIKYRLQKIVKMCHK